MATWTEGLEGQYDDFVANVLHAEQVAEWIVSFKEDVVQHEVRWCAVYEGERQNCTVGQNLRILMKQERTKDWVCLLPWAVLTMNSQRSSSTGFTPHKLFHGGCPAWFFKTLFPDDYKSPVGDWVEHKQDLANLASANLKHVRKRELTGQNRLRGSATLRVGSLVFVHHSRLPLWHHNCLQDPIFGPYHVIKKNGSRIHVRCSPRLGGELLCALKQPRHYHSRDDLAWDEWRLSDKEVERIDLESAATPEEADELEEMTADEIAVDGYYVVARIACPCLSVRRQSSLFDPTFSGYPNHSERGCELHKAVVLPGHRLFLSAVFFRHSMPKKSWLSSPLRGGCSSRRSSAWPTHPLSFKS